jgi:hypothetical protein
METLIVKIKKKGKAAFTKELLKSFDFLEVTTGKKGSSAVSISPERKAALIKGFKEVKLAEKGKLKGKPAAALLKEIRNGKP